MASPGLESLNSTERYDGAFEVPLLLRPAGRPPMNATEKIFALHDLSRNGYVKTGDTIRVSVDWVMASEASWHVSRCNRPSHHSFPSFPPPPSHLGLSFLALSISTIYTELARRV